MVIPVCEFAIPVDGPWSDAQVTLPSNCCAGVRSITPPQGVNDPSLLWGVAGSTHPDDLLDVVTAVAWYRNLFTTLQLSLYMVRVIEDCHNA